MRKAIGFVIVLYAISNMMEQAFNSFQEAIVATFDTVTVAAEVSEKQIYSLTL